MLPQTYLVISDSMGEIIYQIIQVLHIVQLIQKFAIHYGFVMARFV